MHELVGVKEKQGNVTHFQGEYHRMYDSQEKVTNVDIFAHELNSSRIIVNLPGTRGDVNGFADKYVKLGNYVQSEGLGAFVRIGNDFTNLPSDINLRAVLSYVSDNAVEISGSKNPELFLMGFSAGGAAIASIAHEYEQVTRILLGAPSTRTSGLDVRSGMMKFTGEVYIAIGDQDENVGTESGIRMHSWAISSSKRELVVLPNCDHQFRGETNGRILSQMPFWAFSKGEAPKFPNPTGGIVLYK